MAAPRQPARARRDRAAAVLAAAGARLSPARAHLLAIASLALLPLLWLWPCVFGDRTFVPYDVAEFPPASLQLTAAEHAAVRQGKNHDVTEVPPWFVPELELARDELRAGRVPAWNPHARTGAPLHAHGLLGLCYPPNWLALFADDPESRLGWLAWLSLALAGTLAFGLLREVRLPLPAAWFGAMLFELGAPMAANGFFWMRLASLVWLPGVLWSMLCLARHDTLRPGPLLALAVAFAMPWLAGFPPFATTTAVLAGLLLLRLVAEAAGRHGKRRAGALLVRLLAGIALGACLAMPQVLPSLQFFPESARTPDPPLERIAQSRFEVYGLLGYLLPDALSHPTATALQPYGKQPLCFWLGNLVDANGRRLEPNFNYTEYAVWFGSLGLLLAGYGAVRGRGHLRWFLVMVLCLLLALALMVPGSGLLYRLPVVRNVWPMRWLAPAALLLAWLAAIGFERLWLVERRSLLRLAATGLLLAAAVAGLTQLPAAWHAADPDWLPRAIAARYSNPDLQIDVSTQGARDYLQQGAAAGIDRFALAVQRLADAGVRAGLWLGAFAVLLFGFALAAARPRLRSACLHAAVLLTVVELAAHGQPLLRGCERDHAIDTPVHEFLREQARATATSGGFAIVRTGQALDIPSQLPPGQLMVPGVRDLHFYTHFDARSIEPLRRVLGKPFADQAAAKGYLTLLVPDTIPGLPYAPLEHPLFDLLGVRYALAVRFDPGQALPQHAGRRVGPELRGPGGEFFVFERPGALPRAFTVPALRVLPDDEAVLQALADPALQPRNLAFATAADAAGLADGVAAGADERAVRFVADTATRIDLDVGAGTAPWLVLADTFLPGWSATIDGLDVPLVRANHAMRLVRLPAEACRVQFTYRSPGLFEGGLLMGLAVLCMCGIFLHCRRRPAVGRP